MPIELLAPNVARLEIDPHMSLDANSIIASMFVSSLGFVLFGYGRKQNRFPQMATGGLMMLYPYFVSSVPWMLAIVPLLLGLLWLAVRSGL